MAITPEEIKEARERLAGGTQTANPQSVQVTPDLVAALRQAIKNTPYTPPAPVKEPEVQMGPLERNDDSTSRVTQHMRNTYAALLGMTETEEESTPYTAAPSTYEALGLTPPDKYKPADDAYYSIGLVPNNAYVERGLDLMTPWNQPEVIEAPKPKTDVGDAINYLATRVGVGAVGGFLNPITGLETAVRGIAGQTDAYSKLDAYFEQNPAVLQALYAGKRVSTQEVQAATGADESTIGAYLRARNTELQRQAADNMYGSTLSDNFKNRAGGVAESLGLMVPSLLTSWALPTSTVVDAIGTKTQFRKALARAISRGRGGILKAAARNASVASRAGIPAIQGVLRGAANGAIAAAVGNPGLWLMNASVAGQTLAESAMANPLDAGDYINAMAQGFIEQFTEGMLGYTDAKSLELLKSATGSRLTNIGRALLMYLINGSEEALEEIINVPLSATAEMLTGQREAKLFGTGGIFDVKQMAESGISGLAISMIMGGAGGLVSIASTWRETGDNAKYGENLNNAISNIPEAYRPAPLKPSQMTEAGLKAYERVVASAMQEWMNAEMVKASANKPAAASEPAYPDPGEPLPADAEAAPVSAPAPAQAPQTAAQTTGAITPEDIAIVRNGLASSAPAAIDTDGTTSTPQQDAPQTPAESATEPVAPLDPEVLAGDASQGELPNKPLQPQANENIITASTGEKYDATLYHGSGKSAAEIYSGSTYPIAGPGTYYAMTEKQARNYGDTIESKPIHLDNPLVVRDDAEWWALIQKAGWPFPNLTGLDDATIKSSTEKLRETVLADGHDGLIVQYEDDWVGDINSKTGNSVKTIDRVFGHDQVVVYDTAAQTPAKAPAPTTGELTAAQLSEQLRVHDYVDYNGLRFSVGMGTDNKYHGSIRRIQDGSTIVTNSRDRLYRSDSFNTLKEAIDDVVAVAENNGFISAGAKPAAAQTPATAEPAAQTEPEHQAEPAQESTPAPKAPPQKSNTSKSRPSTFALTSALDRLLKKAQRPTRFELDGRHYLANGYMAFAVSAEDYAESETKYKTQDFYISKQTPLTNIILKAAEPIVDVYSSKTEKNTAIYLFGVTDGKAQFAVDAKMANFFKGYNLAYSPTDSYGGAVVARDDSGGLVGFVLPIRIYNPIDISDKEIVRLGKAAATSEPAESRPAAEKPAETTKAIEEGQNNEPERVDGGRGDIRGGSVGTGGLPEAGTVRTQGEHPEGSSDGGDGSVSQHDGKSPGDDGTRAGSVRSPGSGEGLLPGVDAGSTSTADGEGNTGLSENEPVKKPSKRNKNNYRITEDIDSKRPSYDDNVAAIKLVKKLEAEGRTATEEERAILARYKGWGGLKNDVLNGWRSSELKKLLTKEEYQAAKDSILNAHYTSTKVITGIYKAIQRMGFNGGSILEPSMGVGNFFGMLPDKLSAASSLYGVELDTITGLIAKHLYPDAKIDVAGFQDVLYPDGTFDLVVGNVPFSNDIKIPYRGTTYNLHDFFFIKAIDETKPGGVLALITSTGTLDKLSGKTQSAIAKNANLLAAFRLPDNAFKTNAGTSVTTDLLFLQKKGDGIEDNGIEFTRIGEIDGIPVNEYYVEHPKNILGELAYEKDMYGSERVAVHAVDNFEELFEKAMNSVPKGIIGASSVQTAPVKAKRRGNRDKTTFKATDNGAALVDSDGNTKSITGKDADIIKAFLKIKEAYNSLVETERSGNLQAAEEYRKRLNTVYDQFVKNYGSISKNKKLLRQDDDYIRVSGLETTQEKGVVKKSAIFTMSTVSRADKTSASTSEEALSISLNKHGKIDLDEMARLTGKSIDEILTDLDEEIILTPDGEYVLTSKYLSGNIYTKLAAVEGKVGFEKQEALLRATIPTPKTAKDIPVSLGAHWIPPKYITDFIEHLFNTRYVKVEYSKELGQWELPRFHTAVAKYSTTRVDASDILKNTLNNKNITVYDRMADDTRVLNKFETEVAQQKQNDVRQEFSKWIFEDSARREDLENIFNRTLNAYSPMNYKSLSERLDFGIDPDSKIRLRDYQKEAAVRIVFGGNTLLHHGVGTGKTATMIAAAHLMKEAGIANKPMFVVPNGKVNDFRNEILDMYPYANILALDNESMSPAELQRTKSMIATGNWDYVIIYRTAFQKVAVSPDTEAAFIQAQLDDLDRAIRESAGDKNGSSRFEKNLIARKKTLEEKLKAALAKPRDQSVTFEQTGIDALFIDEAHNFKKVGFATTHSISGIDSNTNDITTDLYMKEGYIRDHGGRIVLATATPLTNTLSEMYNMTLHVDPEALRDAGIYSFDGWLNTFADIQSQPEIAPDAKTWRVKERVRGFKSGNELVSLYRQFADVKQTKDVVKELPKAEYVDVVCEATDIHQALLDDFARRSGSAGRGGENMLTITSDGRAAGTDLRLLTGVMQDMFPGITNEELDLPGSKINRAVENIVSEYNGTKATNGTQFVFLDLGVHDGGKRYAFNLYKDLIDKLVKNGIPSSEIANIQDYDGEERRQTLYKAMNSGAIRVLIGSTSKMGEGVNAQNKAVALHHLSVPYRPDNLEQREGRIVRHGNENNNVRIYRYIQEKSFDSYLWQMIERKAAYIAQALNGGEASELEENSEAIVNAREAKAIATGNPLIMEKVGLQDRVDKLRILQRSFYDEQRYAAQRIVWYKDKIKQTKQELAGAKKDAATYEKNKTDTFQIKIGDTVYENRKEAGEALDNVSVVGKVGELYGLDLYREHSRKVSLRGVLDYPVDLGNSPEGNITRIVNTADKTVALGEKRVNNAIREIESGLKDAQETVGMTFLQQDELDTAVARQREVDIELGIITNEVKFDETVVPESVYDDEDLDAMLSVDMGSQDVTSADTSINSSKLPVLFTKVKNWITGTINLDLGGGKFDNAKEYLEARGVTSYIYDKYNRTAKQNEYAAEHTQDGQADTVTISNVLNVINTQEGRDEVLRNALDAVKPDGTVYITVYNGDKTGVGRVTKTTVVKNPDGTQTSEPASWQENRLLDSYIPEVEKYFGNVEQVGGKEGMLVATEPRKEMLDEAADDRDEVDRDLNSAEWTADRVGDPDKTPMSLTDILNKMRHEFGIPIVKGHIRSKDTLGQYNKRTRGIRTRVANDLATAAHELGHHMDNKYKITRDLPNNLRAELLSNLSDGMKTLYPRHKWYKEALAEYFRRYLNNSDLASTASPAFTAHFRSKLSAEDLRKIDDAADEVNAYFSLDATTATSAVRLPEDKPTDFRTTGEKVGDRADVLYQAWVDSNHGISIFDENFGSGAYKMATTAAYSDARAYAILTGDLRDANGKRVGDGLRTALSGLDMKNKTEYRHFGEYLIVKHGPERLKEGLRVYADARKNTEAFMARRQQELEAQYPDFAAISDKLYKFQRALLQTWGVGTGLVSARSYKEWGERWEYYVPFNRAVDANKGRSGAKRGFANQNSTIRKAIGSGLDIIHPVDNIVYNLVNIVNAGTRNNVMRELTNAASDKEGTAIFLEKVPMPLSRTVVDITGLKSDMTTAVEEGMLSGEMNPAAVTYMDLVLTRMEDVLVQYGRGKAHGNVVTVLKGGKPEYWKINDALLLESLTNMSRARLPAVMEVYGRVSRLMTSNITGKNVLWALFSNAFRDLLTYFTYSNDKNPLHMLGGIGSAYMNKIKGVEKSDEIYKEYLAMGGGQTSAYTADKDLSRRIRSRLSGSKKRWLNPLEWAEFISDTVELGPRYSYYKILRGQGLSAQDAFYGSADITVNFRRGGIVSRQINNFVPFFNAGVQGLDKFARWISASDVKGDGRKKAVVSRLTQFIAASAILGSLMWAINSGDDEKKEDYAQLSNYTKNNYFCIPLKNGNYLTIPKPRELGVLSSLFSAALEYTVNKNEYAFEEFYQYIVDTSLPGVVSDVAKLDLAGAIGSLGIVGVGSYMMANRDFLGKPIVSAGMENYEPRDQYTRRTSMIAYAIGQALNVSPQMIDFFFKQTLGGFWKAQTALLPVGSENVDWTLGVQGSYVRDNQYSTDVINRLYDSMEAALRKKNSHPDDRDAAIRYRWFNAMTSFYSSYNKLAKGEATTDKARGTRQTVLNMVMELQKNMDHGYRTGSQGLVEDFCYAIGDTESMPGAMQTHITDDDGLQHRLNAEEYVAFQLDYLTRYWNYVDDAVALNPTQNTAELGAMINAAKRRAREDAAANALAGLGVKSDAHETTKAMDEIGLTGGEYSVYKALLDVANDDGHLTQDEVIAAIESIEGLTTEEQNFLFHTKYESDKNNPFKWY